MGRSPVTETSPRLRLSVRGIVAVALFAGLLARLGVLRVVGSRV
jgi:hypothetical protein